MTQRPGEAAAIDVLLQMSESSAGLSPESSDMEIAATVAAVLQPLIAAAVLADVRVQLEQSGQLAAALFVGRMEQENSNAK